MKMARAATMAVAALLLVQVAFAMEKKTYKAAPTPVFVAPVTHVEPKPVYVKPTVEYCFHAKTAKPTTAAICPAGYTLDEKLNKCFMNAGYSCKVGTLSTDSYGAPVCKFCKPGQVQKDGKCTKDCSKGYVSTLINGVKQCVESCGKGFYAQGTDCISEKKHYEPKQCSTKLCLPGFKLYFTATANVTIKPTGRKLANATPAPVKLPSCICALTLHRKVYQQENEDPIALKAKKEVKVCDAVCPTKGKPSGGKCTLPCPNTCKEILGKCVYGCPSGYTQCKTWYFGKFCVKANSYAPDADVCKVAKKVIKLDKKDVCPMPVAVKPTPALKVSSPASKKTVVVKASAVSSGSASASAVAMSG